MSVYGNPITLGGGGGITIDEAILSILIQSGSTVTITSGNISKVLSPSESQISASDSTKSVYIFNISQDEFGTWAVTATNTTYTATASITISAVKSYSLEMSYRYYLFRSGYDHPNLRTASQSKGKVTVGSASISLSFSGNENTTCLVTNQNAINLSLYKTLVVKASFSGFGTSQSYYAIIFAANSTPGTGDTSTAGKYVAKLSPSTGSNQTISLNISSVNVSGYVGLKGPINGTVTEIYLEPVS